MNKKILLSILVIAMLTLSIAIAWADDGTTSIGSDVDFVPPPPLEPIKWQHRPDMVHGINVISIVNNDGPVVAEDWLCLDGSPVSDLHLWGSYPGWCPEEIPPDPHKPPGVDKFRIRIYSDEPATPNSFSHPKELLYEESVDNFIETYLASIHQEQGYEHKYRYDLDLPRPFGQERGTIYWLSIAAVMPEDYKYPWGWESSIDRWNDFAVQSIYPDKWEMVEHPDTKYTDMAFELTTHEGPIKWLQFPDMADGENIISLLENPVVADDWLCTDGKPITEVHFWGSYLMMGPTLTNGYKHWEQDNPGPPHSSLPNPPGVDVFELSFHENIPAGVDPDMPWSHPGDLINDVWVDYSDVKEQYWDSVPHIDPDGDIWWEHKFYYIIQLREPFEQIQDTVYWLDIGAKPRDDSDWVWGWETSKDHWNDNAVEGWVDQDWWWQELNSPLTTIDFEDLIPGTQYDVGDIFGTAGTAVAVMPFQWSNGVWYSGGHSTVVGTGMAGGSGNEINVNNVNLDFDFSTAPVTQLKLLFGEYGGNLNIKINGDFRNFNDFIDIDGFIIGGVEVAVQDLGSGKGILKLDGTIHSINQFAVGGQELFIDDIKLVKQVDMAFLLTTGKGMCGDVDGNGIINILDVRLLMNHIVNPGAYPVDPWTGNVDGINGININDLTLLLKHVFNPDVHPLKCP